MTRNWWNNQTVRKARSERTPLRTGRRKGFKPAMEQLEERLVLDFRSITGFGNNVVHPEWGATIDAFGNPVALLRMSPAAYADGISAPVVGSPARPSPRAISNAIVAQTTEERVLSDRLMAAMIYGWGQFLDHDLDLTTGANPAEPFNVPVPANDPVFTGDIPFNRSKSVPGTGTSTSNPREQPNEITAFIDASQVYGSSDAVAHALRANDGTGRLKTSAGP